MCFFPTLGPNPATPLHAQKRNTTKGQRSKENRTAESGAAVAGPEGDTEWEKAISLINFGFGRPNGTDLSRFKVVGKVPNTVVYMF